MGLKRELKRVINKNTEYTVVRVREPEIMRHKTICNVCGRSDPWEVIMKITVIMK